MKTRGTAQWTAAAAKTAALVTRSRLHPGVTLWADARPRTEHWAVALSGGADSVALLLLLWSHWPARRARLTAFHFDHRLRGAESSADARFCAALCKALGVPLVSGRWAVRGRPPADEAGARAARFEFIERGMAKGGMRVLWLGHQQDDIAETMLMRLSRGSGSAGLAAPRAIHAFAPARAGGRGRFHVRPLLALKKEEIKAAPQEARRRRWREGFRATRGGRISGTGSGWG